MKQEYSSAELRAHMAANPHNLPRVAGFPQLSNHWIAAARFENEGRQAGKGAQCPYKPESMAANRWLAGNADCREYPRIYAALRKAGYSQTESAACIRDAKRGLEWSSEAVNVSGGTMAAIMAAKRFARYYRRARHA